MKSVKLPVVKCPFECIDAATGQVYEWSPRVEHPRKCPNCQRILSRADSVSKGKVLLRKKQEVKQSSSKTSSPSKSTDSPVAGASVANIETEENREEALSPASLSAVSEEEINAIVANEKKGEEECLSIP